MWVLEWCHPQKAQPAVLNSPPSCQHWEGPGVGFDIVCLLQMVWGFTHWGKEEPTGWCLASLGSRHEFP